jgi:hypothetical protein
MTAGALDGKTPLLIARCLFVKYIVKYLQISLLWLILFKVVTGSAIKSPRYSDPEEYNTHVFDELPDKQDGFVTIDLSDDNNDSKKPNGLEASKFFTTILIPPPFGFLESLLSSERSMVTNPSCLSGNSYGQNCNF